MTTPDTLPTWLTDALDKPLVGPVSLVLLGAIFVLLAYWAITEWNRHVNRELERHRLHAKIARPEVGYEQSLFVIDPERAEQIRAEVARVQAWGDEPREVGK